LKCRPVFERNGASDDTSAALGTERTAGELAMTIEREELEVLEGDEGEPEVGRHRDVGREILGTQIAAVKRAPAVTIAPTATVARAAELMRKKKVSAVIVVERRKGKTRIAGIFTERDLVSRALPAKGWTRSPVKKFMTPEPETLRAKDSVAYALNKMSVGRFRHVPVVGGAGEPLGMVSIRDLVDFIVELCPEEILNLPPEPELAHHPRAEGD
jgi:CBS domain-containing protein